MFKPAAGEKFFFEVFKTADFQLSYKQTCINSSLSLSRNPPPENEFSSILGESQDHTKSTFPNLNFRRMPENLHPCIRTQSTINDVIKQPVTSQQQPT